MRNHEIKEKILKHSLSLEQYGLYELAWNKTDALNLIQELMKDNIGILGGDVYRISTTNWLEPLSDNWSCEPLEQESETAYYIRSKFEALNYIENFSVQSEERIVFSIIFTEKIA